MLAAATLTPADSRLGVCGKIAQCTYRKRRAGQRLSSGKSRRKLRRASDPLFDGIDHPLRIKRGSAVVYYELDLAGNVRGLRLSGGSSLGDYRYTAFGKTVEDTTSFVLPLRWKGRWQQTFGANEVYDVRARQWSPELGAFLSIDGYEYHDETTTLWGWPNQNPIRESDVTGNGEDGDGGSDGGGDGGSDGGSDGGTCRPNPKCPSGAIACRFRCDKNYLDKVNTEQCPTLRSYSACAKFKDPREQQKCIRLGCISSTGTVMRPASHLFDMWR